MLEGENQVQWLRQREKRQTWISMLTGKKRGFMAQMIRQSLQAIVVKGRRQWNTKEALFWRLLLGDIPGHCQYRNLTTGWENSVFINILPCSHFASLCPFSNSEWKFPGKPFLWMECMRFVPGEKKKKEKTHKELQQRPSSPEILPWGAYNTYLFSRMGKNSHPLVFRSTKNVAPSI